MATGRGQKDSTAAFVSAGVFILAPTLCVI